MSWNGSDKNKCETASAGEIPSSPAKRVPVFRGVTAGLIVVATGLGVLGYFFFLRTPAPKASDVAPKAQTAKSTSKEIPAKPLTTVIKREKVATAPVEAVSAPKPKYDTNKWQEVNGFIVPKGARLVNNYLTNKVQRIFKYSTDDVILAYLQPPSHGAMAPMQPIMAGSEKIFLKSLADPIVITESDSEKVRAYKEQVMIAREQIKARLDDGEKFEDILADNYRLMKENNDIRNKAQVELNKLYREGNLEGARKYQIAIDAALQQMGIDTLDEPHRKLLQKAEATAKEK